MVDVEGRGLYACMMKGVLSRHSPCHAQLAGCDAGVYRAGDSKARPSTCRRLCYGLRCNKVMALIVHAVFRRVVERLLPWQSLV